MIRAACPHCNGDLQIDPSYSGQTLRCPLCNGALVAPSVSDADSGAPDDKRAFSTPVTLVIAAEAHVLGLLVLSLLWSFKSAFAFVIFVVLVELAIWQRRKVLALFAQVRESERTKQVVRNMSERVRSAVAPARDPRLNRTSELPHGSSEAMQVAVASAVENNDTLVEIQTASVPALRPQAIPDCPRRRPRQSMWANLSGEPLGTNLPADNVYFYGPGTQLDLGRGVLEWPLVYATGAPYKGTFDASLIDATLPVAPRNTNVNEDLPYWPSYYDCSPAQRSRYLDWLLGGRNDPTIELGYVFIFFYGLERRVVVDHADYITIAQELVRLLPIYDRSNSFRNYASHLLWFALYLASQNGDVPKPLFESALQVTGRWDDAYLGLCLAMFCQRNVSIPPEIAFLVGKHDPRSSSSVIVRRHSETFRELFAMKYKTQFADGMLLKASKNLKRANYHAASATLLHDRRSESALPLMPDVLSLSSQFKPLVAIWDECIVDLKDYNRAHRTSGGELTSEAYESLPQEFRQDDHPEADTWMTIWEEYADADGWPLVPISALAGFKGIPQRGRLTKKQCSRILATADAIGIGVEPDARMTGTKYQWDERVSFFFLESEEPGDSTAYNAASVLLRLGLNIAEADGQVDEVELHQIAQHLEGQFDLTDDQSKRLEQLQYLLLHCPEAENTIGKFLSTRLPHDQRLLVGEFLVGVAATDEVVTAQEIKALKKAYRSLDLAEAELEKLLDRHAVVEPGVGAEPEFTQEFHLDMQVVSRIMTETRQVADILKDAMAVDEDYGEGITADVGAATAVAQAHTATTTVSGTAASSTGLAERFKPFLRAVLGRSEWTADDINRLATEHNVMLSGAVERINEWSSDEYGDWLIQEGDTYLVHTDLLEETI